MAARGVPIAIAGQTAAQGIITAATGDLAVYRHQMKRRRKNRAPDEIELHFNPAAMGVGLVGLGLGLWLMQVRVNPGLNSDGTKSLSLEQRTGFSLDFTGNPVGTAADNWFNLQKLGTGAGASPLAVIAQQGGPAAQFIISPIVYTMGKLFGAWR